MSNILEAIASLRGDQKTPVRSKASQACYEEGVRAKVTDPLTTLQSIQQHFSEVRMLGSLTRYERTEGRCGDVYDEYERDLETGTVIDVRKQIEGDHEFE